MVELLAVAVLMLAVGFALGVVLSPAVKRRLARNRCTSPSGNHEFIHIRGAFAYCHYCPARKRFLNG